MISDTVTKKFVCGDKKCTLTIIQRNSQYEAHTDIKKRNFLILPFVDKTKSTSKTYQQIFEYLENFAAKYGKVKYIFVTQNKNMNAWCEAQTFWDKIYDGIAVKYFG